MISAATQRNAQHGHARDERDEAVAPRSAARRGCSASQSQFVWNLHGSAIVALGGSPSEQPARAPPDNPHGSYHPPMPNWLSGMDGNMPTGTKPMNASPDQPQRRGKSSLVKILGGWPSSTTARCEVQPRHLHRFVGARTGARNQLDATIFQAASAGLAGVKPCANNTLAHADGVTWTPQTQIRGGRRLELGSSAWKNPAAPA